MEEITEVGCRQQNLQLGQMVWKPEIVVRDLRDVTSARAPQHSVAMGLAVALALREGKYLYARVAVRIVPRACNGLRRSPIANHEQFEVAHALCKHAFDREGQHRRWTNDRQQDGKKRR